MSKKLTIEFVRKQFDKEGYTLLTTEYINSWTFLKYICPKGHKRTVTWNGWQQGRRCAGCFGNGRLTIGFVRNSFEEEGYILLTTRYINCYQKLEYICPEKHECNISWLNWEKGKRCRRCWYEKNKGKNNCNYNVNLTKKDRQDKRKYHEYYVWRIAVYERDGYTCQVCLKCGGSLVAHHLRSYSNNKDLRVVISNGITLCKNCHKKFHFIYGRKNNTKEQFEEFKDNAVAQLLHD